MVWEGPRCRGGDARWYRKLRSQCRVPDSHQAPLRAAGVQSCWRLGPVSPEQDTCGSCPAPPASCRLRAAPGRRSPGLLARERRESPQAGWCQSWRQKMEGQGSRGVVDLLQVLTSQNRRLLSASRVPAALAGQPHRCSQAWPRSLLPSEHQPHTAHSSALNTLEVKQTHGDGEQETFPHA